jgi:hypothetical protein
LDEKVPHHDEIILVIFDQKNPHAFFHFNLSPAEARRFRTL